MKRVLEDDEYLAPRHVAYNGVEALQLCPDVKVECLTKPIDGKAVGGAIKTSKKSIQLDLELIIPAGRARMRHMTCIITETEEDEFLLGRLTLEALGIYVEGLLAVLANKEIDDFEPFESETPVSFNPPDKGRIMGQLCELINEAVTNGFPVDRKRQNCAYTMQTSNVYTSSARIDEVI
ncbi:uncharacterized protein PITG_04073 [Phytophthora infestans T30-4]|uniref:Uncharacterized protein n=1 Tax=Phytophthora infestans (strain T30-4) TaxID=403677 RepID=D0N0H5_PHYIT|nr:uncharacterized protein PITG_04073 [Phytophthora infestans T30-4]EEY67138.1 hypothetical protein PITG_04073 [Phytophthora infestans T30-4]|eukprot:XP_002905786.1 hypothetical protein PITG_04073 [Phytophthora infestans T30-4]